MKQAVIFLANGVEECEALLVVDLLRRAGVDIQTAAVGGSVDLVSSHRIPIRADMLAEDVKSDGLDAVILPGGMPGTLNLEADESVQRTVRECMEAGKIVAAICAAPSILGHAGLLEGKRATAHFKFRDQLGGATVEEAEVVEDGNVITSWGLGGAIPFALTLTERLAGKEEADRIRHAISYVH